MRHSSVYQSNSARFELLFCTSAVTKHIMEFGQFILVYTSTRRKEILEKKKVTELFDIGKSKYEIRRQLTEVIRELSEPPPPFV